MYLCGLNWVCVGRIVCVRVELTVCGWDCVQFTKSKWRPAAILNFKDKEAKFVVTLLDGFCPLKPTIHRWKDDIFICHRCWDMALNHFWDLAPIFPPILGGRGSGWKFAMVFFQGCHMWNTTVIELRVFEISASSGERGQTDRRTDRPTDWPGRCT